MSEDETADILPVILGTVAAKLLKLFDIVNETMHKDCEQRLVLLIVSSLIDAVLSNLKRRVQYDVSGVIN